MNALNARHRKLFCRLRPVRKANRLPILPKQTVLQNSTLMIHVPHSIVLCVMMPLKACTTGGAVELSVNSEGDDAGDGIISGLSDSSTAVPTTPTEVERRKPGFDRSIRYQSTGLTSASVKDTCKVEVQGSFRCHMLAQASSPVTHELTMANAIPTKAPILRTTGFQSAASPPS